MTTIYTAKPFTAQPHIRALPLILTVEGMGDHPTDFDTIIRENDFTDEEAEAIATSLLEAGEVRGGGGAAPDYVIRVAVQ